MKFLANLIYLIYDKSKKIYIFFNLIWFINELVYKTFDKGQRHKQKC